MRNEGSCRANKAQVFGRGKEMGDGDKRSQCGWIEERQKSGKGVTNDVVLDKKRKKLLINVKR